MAFLLHIAVLNAQGKTENTYATYDSMEEARAHETRWCMNCPGCESSVVDTFMIEYRTLGEYPDLPFGVLAQILRAMP